MIRVLMWIVLAKMRADRRQVEEWFGEEMEKLVSIDVRDNEECDGRDLNPGYQIGNLMS